MLCFIKEKLHQVKLDKEEFIQDYCNRGERLTLTPNTARAAGDSQPIGALGGKLLGNVVRYEGWGQSC